MSLFPGGQSILASSVYIQSAENSRKECQQFWLCLRNTVILISNDRTSASKKMNWMALIRTLTLSITAFERKKEEIWYQDKKPQKKAPGQKPPEQILYDKTFLP